MSKRAQCVTLSLRLGFHSARSLGGGDIATRG